MTVKDLLSISEKKKELNYIKNQIELMKNDNRTVRPYITTDTKIKKSGQSDVMRKVDKSIDLEQILETKAIEIIKLQAEAYEVFSCLNFFDRELMELRYLNGYTFNEIAEAFSQTLRHTFKRHKNIMDNLITTGKLEQ